MRLIDADALIDEIKHITGQDTIMWFYDRRIKREQEVNMTAFIELMPTIDPVKHGRLIDGMVSFHWTCSECGCHLRKDLGQVFERETDRYNFCPNCGAKNGGEG